MTIEDDVLTLESNSCFEQDDFTGPLFSLSSPSNTPQSIPFKLATNQEPTGLLLN